MTAITQVLWAAMMLLFLAGAVVYAFNPHLGANLLKRSLVLLLVLLVGPSLIRTVIAEIPLSIVLVLGAAASISAYWYVTNQSAKDSKQHGSGSPHAERQPRLPYHQEDDE